MRTTFAQRAMRLRPLPVWVAVVTCIFWTGCTPSHYRFRADRDTYRVLAEKAHDGAVAPLPTIDAPPDSRLFDPYDPDRPPMPPDDPAAHEYMHCVNGMKGYRHWHKNGEAPAVEDTTWRDSLPVDENGLLTLDRERSVQLAVLHSREFQAEREDLYSTALALTLNRFNFEIQWFGGSFLHFDHFGSGSANNEHNTLTLENTLGFTKLFGTGGQLVVDALNTFTWEFAGDNFGTVNTNLGANFLQPLLRRAWRDVRLEGLTQAERGTLYRARDYHRFGKQFYFNVVNGQDGFLSLLSQIQAIRNFQGNVEALQETLREHEALLRAGVVSRIQLDQVFQRYQQGRLELIVAQNRFDDSVDAFKFELGLPPDLATKIDDSLLDPLKVVDSNLADLEKAGERFVARWREMEAAPDIPMLRSGYQELAALVQRLAGAHGLVQADFERWKTSPKDTSAAEMLAGGEQEFARLLADRLNDVAKVRESLQAAATTAADALTDADRATRWQQLQKLSRQLSSAVGELAIVDTQVRVQLIRLEPVGISEDLAVEYALANRLDLMNARGRVVDAWRQIRVAADGLEADLDLILNADLRTDPFGANPVDFSASASSYRVGLRFDSPLNRRAERNIYRSALIAYQERRRNFMAQQDRIVQAVRRDLRQLESDKLSFEIARQSLIVAARQVEDARTQLLEPGRPTDSSNTADVLNALSSMLQARNDLVTSWVNYETSRLQLLLDMEALEVDAQGNWIDASTCTLPQAAPQSTPEAVAPPPAVRADDRPPHEPLPAPEPKPPAPSATLPKSRDENLASGRAIE